MLKFFQTSGQHVVLIIIIIRQRQMFYEKYYHLLCHFMGLLPTKYINYPLKIEVNYRLSVKIRFAKTNNGISSF